MSANSTLEIFKTYHHFLLNPNSGNTNRVEKLSTVDPVIRVACFVKKENNIFNIKMSRSELVSTRRSTVLSLPPE